MTERYGIILLDAAEVIIRIYEKDETNTWKLLRYQTFDLTSFSSKQPLQTPEIVETIAQMSLSRYAMHIVEWKMASRNIAENISKEVSLATSIPVEQLTLTREQELLCKGVLMEIQ